MKPVHFRKNKSELWALCREKIFEVNSCTQADTQVTPDSQLSSRWTKVTCEKCLKLRKKRK